MKKYLFLVNKQSIALIIVGAVMNLMGHSIASFYSLPIYMDSFGTFLVAVLLGPIAGAITGLSFNIIAGFGSYRIVYALVSIAGALTVGLRLYKKDRWDSFTVVGTSVLTGLVMTGIATPLNLYFQEGFTGNIWGDALVEMLSQYTSILLVCSSAGELIVNVPDKIITLILLMGAIYIFKKAGLTLDLEGRLKKEEVEETNSKKTLMMFIPLISFVMAGFLAVPAEAAKDYSSDYAQRVFDMEDGLNSAEINTITQSGDGYIWAGAYSGLYRYDGSVFEQIDLDSKITNAIALFTDSKGRLWIGTNDCGVACFNPYSNEIKFIDETDGLPSNSIRGITEDSYGNIYVSTSSYVCKITLEIKNAEDESEIEEFLPISKIEVYDSLDKIYFVSSMQEVGDNQICGVTEAGALFLMEDGVVLDTLECEEEGNSYYAAANNGKGTFMVGTAGGTIDVVRLVDNKFVKESTIDLGEHSSVNRIIYEAGEEGYFFAAENGFGFVNESGEIQNLTSENFNTAISDVMVDKQGNVWYSSSKQGVLELSKNPFTDLFKKVGIEGDAVNTIVLDGNIVYIGTDSGVVSIDRINNVVVDEERMHIFDNTRVRHILKDSKGNLWFSTYGEIGLVFMGADGSVLNFNNDN
ncbi:MAG: hypothetical protein K5675_02595, partial [Lachnospiraceae bacterium]|nr:hypothetical protein [Lachnospiraceae bacterium]